MPIPLYGVQAQGPHIYSLDDQGVVTDGADLDGSGGVAYVCTMITVPFAASAYARLRRLVQSVPHDGAATVTFTPWRDLQETGQAIVRPLAISDNHIVTVPLSATGSEFQIAVEVSAFDAAAELGTGEVTVVSRRTQR